MINGGAMPSPYAAGSIRFPALTPAIMTTFVAAIVTVLAAGIIATEIGKRTMDEMRGVVQRMQGREDLLLAARTAQADQSYKTALVTRIALTGLSLLAIILLFIVMSRSGKQQALVARQTRMLDSGFDAIIMRDDRDRVIRWNRVAEQLYGWTAAAASGQVTHVLFNTI